MKKLRYFIETCTLKSMAWLLPRLPRHALMALARAVGTLAYLIDYRGRSTAVENLRVAFKGKYGWWERHQITRRAFQNFARTYIDLFWAASVTRDNWMQHSLLDQSARDMHAAARDRGIVWVGPHFGNFEFMALIWGYMDVRFTVIAQNFKNPGLTDIFKQAREVSGHTVIPQQSAMLRMVKALSRGGNVAILTDLNVKPHRTSAIIECFGLKTCVTTIHVMLAQRLGLLLAPTLCVPNEDGTYSMKVGKPIEPKPEDSSQSIAQQCWDCFEPEIRARPELWMWMYKHWRYLPGDGTDDQYPAYANAEDKRFAKMVAGKTV